MDDAPLARLPIYRRRAGRRLAYYNGAIWATGNGLASGTLVIYLAMELGVPGIGLGIGLIKAAPRIAGMLRLAAPALIAMSGSRKRFCLAAYLASAVVLLGLPIVAAPGWLPSPAASLAALVLLWCVYHLLEYLGTVALWSWLADLVPLRIRGRFIGRRNRWIVAGQAAAMLAAGGFSWGWHQWVPQSPRLIGYAIPAGIGAWLMAASLIPLLSMPALERRPADRRAGGNASSGPVGRRLLAPLSDWRYRRLLLFIAWFSFSNGLTQSAQYGFPKYVLGMSLLTMLVCTTAMRVGQFGISPWVGRVADRLGNRPVMIVSLLLTSAALLFYLVSTPEHPWWFTGGWVLWVAYAGLNVCLPNLMLKLPPDGDKTPYIAAFDATSGLTFAAGALLGGLFYDHFKDAAFGLFGNALSLDFYGFTFLYGFLLRSLGVVFLLLVVERTPRKAQ